MSESIESRVARISLLSLGLGYAVYLLAVAYIQLYRFFYREPGIIFSLKAGHYASSVLALLGFTAFLGYCFLLVKQPKQNVLYLLAALAILPGIILLVPRIE